MGRWRRGLALRLNRITRIFRASITSEREFHIYVASVTAVCVGVALTVDVANQLTFFVDWPSCFRSWTITAVLVLGLAVPISRTIGKAQLELYQAKLLAEELGRTDQLTGLPNRLALMEAVSAAKPETLALVIVDIDRFKRVNDTHGHLAGDAVIRSVGQMMRAELGAFGQVSRVGGEEFALLCSGAPPEALAARLIAFREKVQSTPIVIGGLALSVTISAGVAVKSEGETFERLFSEADRALYAAKTSGRNRVRFSPAIEAADGRNGDDGKSLSANALLRSA